VGPPQEKVKNPFARPDMRRAGKQVFFRAIPHNSKSRIAPAGFLAG